MSGGTGDSGASNRYRMAYSAVVEMEDGTQIKIMKNTEVKLLGYKDVPLFGMRLAVIEYNGQRGLVEPGAIEAC